MNDDRLLEELGRTARQGGEQRELHERLEALSAGRLSSSEQRRLRQDVAAAGLPEGTFEACMPLESEARERILAGLGDRLADADEASPAQDSEPDRRPLAALWDAFERSLDTPRVLAFSGAAAALALLVVVGLPDRGFPLPAYEVEPVLERDTRDLSGPEPDASVMKLRAGGTLDVIFRPRAAPDGQVTASTFLVQRAEPQPIALPVVPTPEGVVRIVGVVGDSVDLPEGPSRLIVVITPGRGGAPPEDWRELRHLEVRQTADRVVVALDLLVASD